MVHDDSLIPVSPASLTMSTEDAVAHAYATYIGDEIEIAFDDEMLVVSDQIAELVQANPVDEQLVVSLLHYLTLLKSMYAGAVSVDADDEPSYNEDTSATT